MNSGIRWVFGITIAASLALVALALHCWGAAEIRAEPGEVFFLTIFGAVCLVAVTRLFSWFGLSLHDDAVERKNAGALIALCAAVFAVALIYSGGSVGEGPSYSNNVFSVGIALAAFFALWLVLEIGGRVSASITEERDTASGIRLAGFFLAIGLILARAVAGDWHSESGTVHDFLRDGWPAMVLGGIALLVERLARPSRQNPFPTVTRNGFLPAALYLMLCVLWLWHLGPWEGMHHP